MRQRRPRCSRHVPDKAEQRGAEIPFLQPTNGSELALDDRVLQRTIRDDRVHQRRDVQRILVGVQHASPVHGGRHGRRPVRENRDLQVEGLDDRHAETLVLACAKEEIGDLVVRDQLLIGHMTGEMDVSDAEIRDQVVEHRQVSFESVVRSHHDEP